MRLIVKQAGLVFVMSSEFQYASIPRNANVYLVAFCLQQVAEEGAKKKKKKKKSNHPTHFHLLTQAISISQGTHLPAAYAGPLQM